MKSQIISLGRYLPSRVARGMAYFAVRAMGEEDQDEFRQNFQIPSIEWSLRNMNRLGFRPGRIVDIGAYVGDWTRMAKRIFPAAEVHMIEAQSAKSGVLKRVVQDLPLTSFEIALLGPERRSAVSFHELESGSGVFEEQSRVARETKFYSMQTLDEVLAGREWTKIGLIKIDVQGYELEVLKGASATLADSDAILVEVSLIPVNKGAPLAHDVIDFLHQHGFRLYDICSFIRRPLDRALWQSDFIFVRQQSPLLSYASFD